jgi:hypothetical protein
MEKVTEKETSVDKVVSGRYIPEQNVPERFIWDFDHLENASLGLWVPWPTHPLVDGFLRRLVHDAVQDQGILVRDETSKGCIFQETRQQRDASLQGRIFQETEHPRLFLQGIHCHGLDNVTKLFYGEGVTLLMSSPPPYLTAVCFQNVY